MKQTQILSTFLCVLLFCLISNGQEKGNKEDFYNFFDGIVGVENSDLHYGKVYQEKYRIKSKKTKFFPEADFVFGSLVFNGQPYFDISLKYNVYDDELLMQVDKRFGGDILQLHKKQVSNFKIGKHFFVKIDNTEITGGFYEVVLEKQFFLLLKKHRKSLKELLGEKLIFYEFENEDEYFFLQYQNTYHSIKKASTLISIFPKYEVELKSFDQNQDSSQPFDSRLKNLLEYLDTLWSGENTKKKGN